MDAARGGQVIDVPMCRIVRPEVANDPLPQVPPRTAVVKVCARPEGEVSQRPDRQADRPDQVKNDNVAPLFDSLVASNMPWSVFMGV